MKNKIITLLTLLVLVSLVTAESNIKSTNLFETPEEWCHNLNIDVTGINVSSNNYDLIDCGEYAANRWVCNCDQDRDFQVTFVNSKYDTNTYIVDIKTGTTTQVKRVVSKNSLYFENKDPIINTGTGNNSYSYRLLTLEKSVAAVTYKVDNTPKISTTLIKKDIKNLQTKVSDLETAPRENDIPEVIENNYDDSELKAKFAIIENRINSLNQKSLLLRLVVGCLAGFLMYGFALATIAVRQDKIFKTIKSMYPPKEKKTEVKKEDGKGKKNKL